MDHLALLEDEVVAMTAALRAADPTRPVASCPGWTVADLTAHLTGVHRWALAALRDGGQPPYDEHPSDADAYSAAATELVARLQELPTDAPCWTFSSKDRTAGFWRRRQLQEVSVHRWDVAQHAIDPDVAADGVDEVVSFFLPRQFGRGQTSLPVGTLEVTTDKGDWTLVEGNGPHAVVSGDVATVNLLLWGRRTLDETSVSGDAAFAKAVLSAALTP